MKYTNIWWVMLSIFIITSCNKTFEEINTNPNQPTSVDPEALLPSIIRSMANRMDLDAYQTSDRASQLITGTFVVNIETYSWSSRAGTWTDSYTALRNLKELETIAIAQGNTDYQAISKILKAWIIYNLTSISGDIPYLEATRADSLIFTPTYDTQQEIITGSGGLLEELAAANTLIQNTTTTVSGDILFDGDMSKWQRFGNSLRLRILIGIAHKTDVSASFQSILDNDPIIDDNSNQAVLTYLDFPNSHPITSVRQGDFDEIRIAQSTVNAFEQYADPRLAIYARPTDETINTDTLEYLGWLNGGFGCDNSGSRLGYAYYDYPGHPTVSEKANGMILTNAETKFTIAEAIQRGIATGDAEAYYKSGIQSSMDYYNVDYSSFGWVDFEDFYTNSGIAYDGTLDQIMEQKWIALFFSGMESYFHLRRYMYLVDFDWNAISFVDPPCGNTNNDILPLRFPYPDEEALLNSTNYNAAVSRIGSDEINSKMWLME